MKFSIAKYVITMAVLIGSISSASATLVRTSGSAASADVSVSFDQAFKAVSDGRMSVIHFNIDSALDAERDAIRFSGADQLDVSINGVTIATEFFDFNDGSGSLIGPFIFFDNSFDFSSAEIGIAIEVGDLIRISGSANNGSYAFGSGSVNNYTLLSTGRYDLTLTDSQLNVLATAVSEPAAFGFIILAFLANIVVRKRTKVKT